MHFYFFFPANVVPSCSSTISWKGYSSFTEFGTLVQNQLGIFLWVYFWILWSLLLMYMSFPLLTLHSFHYRLRRKPYICDNGRVIPLILCFVFKVKVAQSCPTLCDLVVYTVGILWARRLEWVAFPFSTGSSQPRAWTQVSHIAGRCFTSWVTTG